MKFAYRLVVVGGALLSALLALGAQIRWGG